MLTDKSCSMHCSNLRFSFKKNIIDSKMTESRLGRMNVS